MNDKPLPPAHPPCETVFVNSHADEPRCVVCRKDHTPINAQGYCLVCWLIREETDDPVAGCRGAVSGVVLLCCVFVTLGVLYVLWRLLV